MNHTLYQKVAFFDIPFPTRRVDGYVFIQNVDLKVEAFFRIL